VATAITIEENNMLSHPTLDRLHQFSLAGMERALEEQCRLPDSAEVTFEDRLATLVDREAIERENKRLAMWLRFAGVRQAASPEDVDYRAARGLDRALFQKLAATAWLEQHPNLPVTGPTGVGKI
jgi:DNA replication protein DnaC